MKSHKQNRRIRFVLEALEGRVALSHMGAVVEDGTHRHGGGQAEVRHGADDPANYEANHDVNHGADHPGGGAGEAVHHHRGGRA